MNVVFWRKKGEVEWRRGILVCRCDDNIRESSTTGEQWFEVDNIEFKHKTSNDGVKETLDFDLRFELRKEQTHSRQLRGRLRAVLMMSSAEKAEIEKEWLAWLEREENV